MARIYQVSSMGEAHVKVCIVSNRTEADMLVHRVSSWGLAHGDSLWCVTRNRQDATCLVYFTSKGMADVSIFFVDTKGESGWLKPHRLKGRFA